jgi:hypothetical protein
MRNEKLINDKSIAEENIRKIFTKYCFPWFFHSHYSYLLHRWRIINNENSARDWLFVGS